MQSDMFKKSWFVKNYTRFQYVPLIMIIPIRCFTCGKVIADKWRAYEKLCIEQDTKSSQTQHGGETIERKNGLLNNNPRDEILNTLGMTRMCCRRHMLTHVDLHDHA